MYDTVDRRWRAVQARDRAADTAFVYAVTTTRIYCRPTCPARLARRANVKFFDTTTDAASESFRPCKRCKPDQIHVHRATELVERAKEYIRLQQGEVTLDQLADHLGISSRYLHHIFSKAVGCTPAAYALTFKNKSLPNSTSSSSMAPSIGGPLTPNPGDSSVWINSCASGFDSLPMDSIGPMLSPYDDENEDLFTPSLSPEEVQMLWDSCGIATDQLMNDFSWDVSTFDDPLFNAAPLENSGMLQRISTAFNGTSSHPYIGHR